MSTSEPGCAMADARSRLTTYSLATSTSMESRSDAAEIFSRDSLIAVSTSPSLYCLTTRAPSRKAVPVKPPALAIRSEILSPSLSMTYSPGKSTCPSSVTNLCGRNPGLFRTETTS